MEHIYPEGLSSLPRMRGDPPHSAIRSRSNQKSTPHARGSTPASRTITLIFFVYPACAGIHPHALLPPWSSGSLPRMRGDPPGAITPTISLSQSTPHARGSTPLDYRLVVSYRVYPACAGIHHLHRLSDIVLAGLPRMRGDPPPYLSLTKQGVLSTPHARGSTREALRRVREYAVYPACAGIHLLVKFSPI